MALASLIVGTAELEHDGGGVRAAMPFLGHSLIEHQARQAAAAGAKHIVILVERVPAALVGAVDRLKRDGIAVELARSVADAADRIHPEERLLVIADGLIARQELVARAGQATAPSLFVVPDSQEMTMFERIDAGSRWAGLALIDGSLLRKTVAMLGDWDLQSTLLRRIVQAQAARIEVPPAGVSVAATMMQVRKAETALLTGEGLGTWLPVGLREILTSLALSGHVTPIWLRLTALLLASIAALLGYLGWFATAALALAASGPLLALPARIDEIALRPARWSGLWLALRDGLAALAVLALAWRFDADGGGWGIWPLAAGSTGIMVVLRGMERLIDRLIAGPSAMALLLLPFAIAGLPHWGLAAIGLAGLGALIVCQRTLARRIAAAQPTAEQRV